MFPRQLLKAIIVMHVNELKSFKKIEIDDQKKNLNEKKKVSCECSGSILKNKQTTATKNKKKTKNNLLKIRAIQSVIAVF